MLDELTNHDDDTGRRLQQLRRAKGLSQRELARRSGVSNATISLIEHGRTSPSVGMLKRILHAVPISMSDFFAFKLEREERVFYREHDLIEIGSGAISFRQVGKDLANHSLQILYECYRPGADTGRSPLTHESEEGGIVIAGRLEVTVGSQTQVLGPGDAFLFNSRVPHRFRNVGRDDCIAVTACTPPSF